MSLPAPSSPGGPPPPPAIMNPSMMSPMDPAMWSALDHSRNTLTVHIVAITCIVLATTAVGLRLYTRQFLLHNVGADDYMAIASLAGVLTVAVTLLLHLNHGLGWHIWDLITMPLELVEFFKFFYLGVVFYNATLLFIKLSLFLQYWRLIRQVSQYRKIFFIVAGIVIVWATGILLAMILICIPIEGYWDKTIPAQCIPDRDIQIINAAGNIATDFMLLVFPIPIIWRLNLTIGRKVALTGLFGLGVFGCIISVLRAYFVIFISASQDLPNDAVGITSWTLAEITTGTICSCLVTLQPLLKRWIPGFGSPKRNTDPSTAGRSKRNPSGKPWSRNTVSNEEDFHESQTVLHPSSAVELGRTSSQTHGMSLRSPSFRTEHDIPLERFDTQSPDYARYSATPGYGRAY